MSSEDFVFSNDDIKRWMEDNVILSIIEKKFRRIRREKQKFILESLIKQQPFKTGDLGSPATIAQFNWTIFGLTTEDQAKKTFNKQIDIEVFKKIRSEVITEIKYIEKSRRAFEYDEEQEEKSSEFYFTRKYVTFETIRKVLCDEAGKVKLVYDFDNPDMEVSTPQNTHILQRVKLQILSPGVKFDYSLIYKYNCEVCEQSTIKKAYEVTTFNTKTKCAHFYNYVNANGESKSRECGTIINYDKDLTINKDAYFYEIGYEDSNTKFASSAFSLNEHKPGFYDCVMYKISSGRTELFFIVDVKKVEPNNLELPQQITTENYLFTLQKAFDFFVAKQTGMEIYGLNPIKCALILQKLANEMKERLVLNVMMVGDPSTGKSMLLKYYSFLLYNYRNMSTNGLSVSIPGLRGTKSTINLFSKDIKIITIGHLGTFHSIHIDEAGENPELVQNLKSFLLEDDYSYDKAGSTGISNERTAHLNVSQNLNYDHVGQYRGAIRKSYKELNITINGIEKEEWNEEWDLFLPIHQYNNPQLRKVIKEKRLEFKQKMVWWIDGLDYALHERFPFYFYLVNEKQDPVLNAVVAGNSSRKTLSKKLEVIRALYVENIDQLFSSLISYQFSDEDNAVCSKIDKIIHDYGFIFDTRTMVVYYMIARLSRIINKRTHYDEMDFDLVRWYLETTNTKLDIVDTNEYHIKGPPNKEEQHKKDIIEENSRSIDDSFGLPPGEFS